MHIFCVPRFSDRWVLDIVNAGLADYSAETSMDSESYEALEGTIECIGYELQVMREEEEPLSQYALRLVQEIDLTIPQMLETRQCLLQISWRLRQHQPLN